MFSVAIDGPAGAGKSSISRQAAKNVGFIYVDTGALYRAVGLSAMERQVNLEDSVKIGEFLSGTKIELEFKNGEQRVLVNGKDVSDFIRTPEVSMMASKVSAIPAVRDFLFDLQQSLAKLHNVVMDGRDIGTVVLPNAQLKIFLTASPEERAKRRYRELIEKDPQTDYEQVLAEIKQRDYQDSHREIAPLKPAQDSVLVDTSNLNLEQSIDRITELIKERLSRG